MALNNYFANPVKDTVLIHGFEVNSYYKKNIDCVPQHAHDFYEIYFFLYGDALFNIGDASIELVANTVIIVPPNTSHHIQFLSDDKQYGRIVLWVQREIMEPILAKYDGALDPPNYHFALGYDAAEQVHMILTMMTREMDRLDDHLDAGRMERHSCALLTDLLLLEMSRCIPGEEETDSSFVQEIKHHIKGMDIGDLTVKKIAQDFHFSEYHIMKKFKKASGMTLYSYLNRQKLLYAKRLMAAGETAMQAAVQAGFGEYSTFYKAFIKEFSLSPREYMHSFNR